MPAGAAIARFYFLGSSDMSKAMVVKGSSLPVKYVPYAEKYVSTVKVSDDNFENGTKFNYEGVTDGVAPYKLEGVNKIRSINKFNKEILTEGYFDDTKTFQASSDYLLTFPEPVEEGQTYTKLTPGYNTLLVSLGIFVQKIVGKNWI